MKKAGEERYGQACWSGMGLCWAMAMDQEGPVSGGETLCSAAAVLARKGRPSEPEIATDLAVLKQVCCSPCPRPYSAQRWRWQSKHTRPVRPRWPQPHSCSLGAGLECTIRRPAWVCMSIAAAQDRLSAQAPCQHMHKLAGLLLEPPAISLSRIPYPATTWPAPLIARPCTVHAHTSSTIYTPSHVLYIYTPSHVLYTCTHLQTCTCAQVHTCTATYLPAYRPAAYVRTYAPKHALGILLSGTLHNALAYAFIIHPLLLPLWKKKDWPVGAQNLQGPTSYQWPAAICRISSTIK